MQEHSDVERKIQKILYGPQLGALLYTVLDLKIPEFLSSGPKTIDEIAQELAIPRDKLERVLLALETERIFDYNPESRQFMINQISERFLDKRYVDYIKLNLAPWMFDLLSALPDCLKLDKTSPEVHFNSSFTDYLGQKPEVMKEYLEGLSSHVKWAIDDVIPAIDLSSAHKVLEIGGHSGDLLLSLAKVHRNIQGTVYDQTLYRQCIEKKIQECQLGNRIKVASGNYIDKVPEGFDAVVWKCIASEYSDECFDRILRNVRQVLSPGSKVFMLEKIMDRSHPEHKYKFERYSDILFWSLTDGRVRTREELEPLLERNGLRIVNMRPAKTDFVIEAVVV